MAIYAATILADSPIAYWRLGESSGTTAYDEAGSADGTYVNTPTLGATGLIAGDADTAVSFDRASTEYVNIPSSVLPAGSSAGVSVECWLDPTEQTPNATIRIASWGVYTSGNGFLVLYRYYDAVTWGIQYYWWDGSAARTTNFYASEDYLGSGAHHFVLVHDYSGQTVKIYVDGSQYGSTADVSAYGTPGAIASGSAARIGAYTGNTLNTFAGTIDEVAFYGVLSASQIAAHYEAGSSSGAIAGSAAGSSTATGALTTQIALAAAAAGSSTATGALTTQIALAGSAAGSSTASAALTTQIALAGTAAGTSSATAVLGNVGDTALAGTAAGTSSGAATLTTAIRLATVVEGSSSAAALLTTAIALAGVAQGSASASGVLTDAGDTALAGTAAGTSTASGILTTAIALAGSAAGTSTGIGSLTVPILLAGTAAGTSSGAGILTTAILLSGSAAGASDGLGTLTVAQIIGLGAVPPVGWPSGGPSVGSSVAPMPGRGTPLGRPSPGTSLSTTPVVGHPISTEP